MACALPAAPRQRRGLWQCGPFWFLYPLSPSPFATAQDSPFPLYDQVKAEHVVPGIKALLAQMHREIDELEGSVQPTWEGVVEPLERIMDRLGRAWGTVSHLKAVRDSEDLRAAVEEVQPEKVKLSLRLSQSRPLYEAFKAIREGDGWAALSEAQQRIVEGELRDFVLGGVALEVRPGRPLGAGRAGWEQRALCRRCCRLLPACQELHVLITPWR